MIRHPLLMRALCSLLSLGLAGNVLADFGVQEPAGYTSRIDGPGTERISATTTDAQGNVYVVGYGSMSKVPFEQTIAVTTTRDLADDDSGRPTLASSDSVDLGLRSIFVVKYDPAGNVLWVQTSDQDSDSSSGTGIVVDEEGNVYVSGQFSPRDPPSFGGLRPSATLRSNANFDEPDPDSAATLRDNVFVAMLSPNGLWQWVRSFNAAVFATDLSSAVNPGTEVETSFLFNLQEAPELTTDVGAGLTPLVIDGEGSLYLRFYMNLFIPTPFTLTAADNNQMFWLRSEGAGQVALGSIDGEGNVVGYDQTAIVAKLAKTSPNAGSPEGTEPTWDWRWIAPVNSEVIYNPFDGVDGDDGIIQSIGTQSKPAWVTGMAVDDENTLYLSGSWTGKLVASINPRDATTSRDGFVAAWRASNGRPQYLATYWGRTDGVDAPVESGELLVDDRMNAYLAGFSGGKELVVTSQNGNVDTLQILGADDPDIGGQAFVGKLGSAGEWQWAEGVPYDAYPLSFNVKGVALAQDPSGALYLAGAKTFGFLGFFSNSAFLSKLRENEETDSRVWEWHLRTEEASYTNTSAVKPLYQTGDILAGEGGAVYWSVNGGTTTSGSPVDPASSSETYFSAERTPQQETSFPDRYLDTITGGGAFLLPILSDSPTLSPTFRVTKTVVCGTEVTPPDGVYRDPNGRPLEPEYPATQGGSAQFYWDGFSKKLFAVSPSKAIIRWKVSSDLTNSRRLPQAVDTFWPTIEEGLTIQVTGAGPSGNGPQVSLEPPSIGFTFNSILYQDNGSEVKGAKVLSTQSAGYSVLLYTEGRNTATGTAAARLDVVRSYLWSDPAVYAEDTAVIGRAIDGADYGHSDPVGKSGYIVNAKSRFDGTAPGAAYDIESQTGLIIPVNTDEEPQDDDLVVIWSNLNPRGVGWPAKAVNYECTWDEIDGYIVVASQLGSESVPAGTAPGLDERLDPAKFQSMSVYHQPKRNLPGYNPNEEHALLAPSNDGSGFQAVFALRTDLNNLKFQTSKPYALLRYQDVTDGLQTKFMVYEVRTEQAVAEGPLPKYLFSDYSGTAATPVNAPYPLSLLGGADGTEGVGAAYFKDRKNQVWAKSAGELRARYFYPLQPNFWYDTNGDRNQDEDLQAPWLDRYASTPGTPLEINYEIAWPPSVPELAVGDTLTDAKDGLPDIEAMASVAVIHDETGAPSATSGLRIIDYTEERQVPVNAAINGRSFVLGDLGLDVEPVTGGRYRFSDLPYHLKSRLSFDPINKQLIFGGYKEEVVGAPLLLLNVMSSRERDRLLAFDGLPNFESWDDAILALYKLSRNPNGVDLDNNNIPDDEGYFVGLGEVGANELANVDALGPKALTTGKVGSLGYVTLVENNADGLGAAPITLHILRIVNPPVVGELKVIPSDNAFDESITVRHANDFGGDPDGLNFEWYYQLDTGTKPTAPINPTAEGWTLLESGDGVNDVTIEGTGIRTLADIWVFARYKGYSANGYDPNTFTDWAGDPSSAGTPLPQFVPGWIKRVLEGVGPFEARVKDFASSETQTYSSFIQQAGGRYEGPVALNSDPDNLNGLGLIELYETVLDRGLTLSYEATPPIGENSAVSNALLLASTRISDFYMLLGNEAYADAQDPTIGFTSADGEVGNLAPSVFAFANQLPSLIAEELTLLRGRDDTSAGVGARPVYNRLFPNFTNGLEGEPVYVQNYGITDQDFSGVIDENDALDLFPQGHGDAWGHYLAGLKRSYRLLKHPLFVWEPRAETTLVGGVAIEVDYIDEVKFARAVAAQARAGAEIVDLTYRSRYVADPSGQWQGYRDSDAERAWGVDEWGRRAGQAAYFGWLTANALLPDEHEQLIGLPDGSPPPATPPTGLQKIDRTTVTELEQIAAAFSDIQGQMDEADQGLNPLGVTPGTIPFDIDPTFLEVGSGIQGQFHFEQILERALKATTNARQVFDYANELTQRLRQTQISADEFATDVQGQELDFRNRLIEIFGYPHPGNIGSGKAYPTGYNGPDLAYYNYVPVTDISGSLIEPDESFTAFFKPFAQDWQAPPGGPNKVDDLKQVVSHYFSGDSPGPSAETLNDILEVEFPVATSETWAFAVPADWGQRRATGELQLSIADMVRAEAELRRARLDYKNHLAQIQDELDLLRARFGLQAENIQVQNTLRNDTIGMNTAIGALNAVAIFTEKANKGQEGILDSVVKAIPKSVGTSFDAFAPIRGTLKAVAANAAIILDNASGIASTASNSIELAKEEVALTAAIKIEKNNYRFEVQEALKSIEALLREEVGLRIDLFALTEALRGSSNAYLTKLAEGDRILEERLVYRRNVAGAVQQNRYQDLTFRLFRNDALQKYRAAFDLAARYAYLAATTYDYETVQLGSSNAAGRRFLTDIVRERALGQFIDDQPVAGVNGLSDPLGRLSQNYDVLKGRLGINNPQIETGRFSLRSELFRKRDESDEAWRDLLETKRVEDLWAIPEFRRFCRPFASEFFGPQPGIVITFSTDITFGQNFFGNLLAGGDSSYDSSNFATKINSAGVWFENYNGQGLSNTPRVYLIPAGLDIMRAPDDVNLGTREFDVVDQAIPVPFQVGASDLTNPDWIPTFDSLDSPMNEIRKFSRFRAYHDGGGLDENELVRDTRLVGRSVWNTKWMLIIPGGTFLNDPDEGLDTFIQGKELPGSSDRDGNGISDIKLFFETYSYSGN